jgi:hypothetical protein
MLLAALAFGVCFVGAAAVFAGTWCTSRLGPWVHLATAAGIAVYAAVLFARPRSLLLPNLVVTLVAIFVGSSLARLLKGYVGLASFCIAAAVADVVSYTGGATAKLSEAFQHGTSNLLQYLCLSLPVQGRVVPIVGLGDLLILAAIYSALRHLGNAGACAFRAPLAGLLVAVFVGLLAGGTFALPFIAATTLPFAYYASRHSQSV